MSVTVTAKPIILSRYASSSQTTEYTAPSSTRTIIDKFTVTNVTGGAVTITIQIVTNGNTAATNYIIVQTKSVASAATADITELKNHVLNTGDFISVIASAGSSLVIRASGREVVTS